MQAVSGALAGVVFAIGLALSGMTQPQKVIAFLDVTGRWDPSLACVMAGAIAVYAPLYRFVTRHTVPLYAQQFVVSADKRINWQLVAGAALFGVGWGIAGYCPGPALTALGTFALQPAAFVACMIVGMLLHRAFERQQARTTAAKL
jgi:uncharacterized membrane protein YedE/YeeE